jgi:hypothetical protein
LENFTDCDIIVFDKARSRNWIKGGYVVFDPGLIPDRGLLDELGKIPILENGNLKIYKKRRIL